MLIKQKNAHAKLRILIQVVLIECLKNKIFNSDKTRKFAQSTTTKRI